MTETDKLAFIKELNDRTNRFKETLLKTYPGNTYEEVVSKFDELNLNFEARLHVLNMFEEIVNSDDSTGLTFKQTLAKSIDYGLVYMVNVLGKDKVTK